MSLRYLFCSLIFLSTYSWSDQTFIYQAALEGKETQTMWTVENLESNIKISGKSRGNDIQVEYSPHFDLMHYQENDSNTQSLEIHRAGSSLEVKNNAKTKTLKLGNLPWIQEFKFGFQPFLKSQNKEHFFGIFYSKDNSIHEMVATKEKIEQVMIGIKSYETQKLKITLKGFKKRFWKAEAWFDLETNLMVKYRSNEGPGTPHVEVTLVQN